MAGHPTDRCQLSCRVQTSFPHTVLESTPLMSPINSPTPLGPRESSGVQPGTPPARLHTIRIGTGPRTVVFLHGLLGQGKNLAGAAKSLDGMATSLLIDAPDHGLSPWTQKFDYRTIASRIAHEIELTDVSSPVVLVGHSMGGKIAMCLALDHPELVAGLCVVDIAPVSYPVSDEFPVLLRAMRGLDLSALADRRQVDDALRDQVPNNATRGFILQNLHHRPDQRGGQRWYWRAHLDLLFRDLDIMESFPDFDGAHWDGPTLWIAGATSSYVLPSHRPVMTDLFPRTRLVTIKDAGHWVHADQPAVFNRLVTDFVASTAAPH
jgi:esterase